jgi:hypothetical protein
MQNSKLLVLAVLAMSVAGCNPPQLFHKTSKLGEFNVLSVDANQRLVLEGNVNGQRVICAEPSPDAISANAAAVAAKAKLVAPTEGTLAGGSADAGFAAGYSQSVASIAMRTQTIQVLRDGYFRLCEAHMNGLLDKEDYQFISAFIDEFITTVAAIEAIGGSVQVAPVIVTANQQAKADENAVESGNPPQQQPSIPPIIVDSSKVDAARAHEIRHILDRYYRRKAEFHKQLYLMRKAKYSN